MRVTASDSLHQFWCRSSINLVRCQDQEIGFGAIGRMALATVLRETWANAQTANPNTKAGQSTRLIKSDVVSWKFIRCFKHSRPHGRDLQPDPARNAVVTNCLSFPNDPHIPTSSTKISSIIEETTESKPFLVGRLHRGAPTTLDLT